MYNEKLNKKLYEKLENTMEIYGSYVFEKVGELENVQGYFTKEHLRSVPESGWAQLTPGTRWGGEWQNLWVKGSFTVPEKLAEKKLFAVPDCGGVEQLYFLNGIPKGIINTKNTDHVGGSHSNQLMGASKVGTKYDLAFECYAGHFCVGDSPYQNIDYPNITMPDFMHTFNRVDICTRNEDVFTLIFDLREILNAATKIPENSFLSARAKRALEKVSKVLVLDPKHCDFDRVIKGVKESLLITRPFFTGKNSRIFGKVGIIGHSHMDTAWLWPVSETIRKCARTYANALYLMEQYPDYKFVQSSALHSEWMKDYYPDIFTAMKQRVKEGRYEPNGGVYVECDCNITSGELMVRQFLKGQQFTRENFNYTADSFWLPDTFGYNANIPQIMRGSEVKYFYTTKISWNEQNKFPFESFTWKGIDGSEVLTHFNRTHCWPDVNDCTDAINQISLKDTTDMRLVAYGYGDGGGGPTPGMIESSHRAAALEGMPEIKSETISDFMQELEKTQNELPVYNDELYLELHRGTLTQMHEVKRKNRKAEFCMRDMEYFNVLSGEKRNESSDKWLKTLLKNQFHDILPGTCITPVYELYNTEMSQLIESYKKATADYASLLTENSSSYTLFNTLSFDRNDVMNIENAPGFAKNYPSQMYTDVCGRKMLAVGKTKIAAFSSLSIDFTENSTKAKSAFSYDGTTLETPFAKICFDSDGYIASLTDKKSQRELRKPNSEPLNVLLYGEDVPDCWDNWDLERDIIYNLSPVHGFKGRTIVTDGEVEIRLRTLFELGDGSTAVQDMICYADSPRIDFHTLVHWNNCHRLLKAGFDLDIASSFARNEIQYGYIKRPTTQNNTLEYTKFEVCNYKYTDVSEPYFGAAIINDCKYGITVTDCNLRLSLHRGGCHPDVSGDKGDHEITYSLLIHNGGFNTENVIKPAYELNVPAVVAKGTAKAQQFAKIAADNIICESVKPAEDDSNAFVMRLYECEGAKTTSKIELGTKVKKALLTNLLEDEKNEIGIKDNSIELCFGPFEIKTVKFYK